MNEFHGHEATRFLLRWRTTTKGQSEVTARRRFQRGWFRCWNFGILKSWKKFQEWKNNEKWTVLTYFCGFIDSCWRILFSSISFSSSSELSEESSSTASIYFDKFIVVVDYFCLFEIKEENSTWVVWTIRSSEPGFLPVFVTLILISM